MGGDLQQPLNRWVIILARLLQYVILIFHEFSWFFKLNIYSSQVISFSFIIFIPCITETSPNLVWMFYLPLAYKDIIGTVSAVKLKGLAGTFHHTQQNPPGFQVSKLVSQWFWKVLSRWEFTIASNDSLISQL